MRPCCSSARRRISPITTPSDLLKVTNRSSPWRSGTRVRDFVCFVTDRGVSGRFVTHEHAGGRSWPRLWRPRPLPSPTCYGIGTFAPPDRRPGGPAPQRTGAPAGPAPQGGLTNLDIWIVTAAARSYSLMLPRSHAAAQPCAPPRPRREQEGTNKSMTRIRQQNVLAAQWTSGRRGARRARPHRCRQPDLRRERLQPRDPAPATPKGGR